MTRILGQTVIYSYFIIVIIINIFPLGDNENPLMDFGSFYASGIKIQNGENPYDPNSEYIFEIIFTKVNAGGKMVNLNPPISVVFFSLLPRFDPVQGLLAWRAVSVALYVIAVLTLATRYTPYLTPARFIWAFTLAGFWHTLALGQIYVLLLVLATAAWLLMQKGRHALAGIAIGLVIALKPNFAVWAIFLLLSGYFVSFVAATISAVVVSLIPAAFYGAEIYAQWLEASALQHATLIMPGNNSIVGLMARFNYDTGGLIVSGFAIVAMVYLTTRPGKVNQGKGNLETFERISALGILASLLASPIAWTGYTILLLPAFFSLKKWPPLVSVAATILSIPFATVLQLWQDSFINFVVFGWLYGWALLCLVAELLINTTATRTIQTN